MKTFVYIIFLVLCLNIVFANTIEYNTTVTLDWIGNDEFYLRTEDIDTKFSCNNTQDYKMNLTFEVDVNDTPIYNSDIILSSIRNMTNHCSVLDKQFNCSEDLVARIEAHERTVVRYEDCKLERAFYESGFENTTTRLDECDTSKQDAIDERNTIQNNYDICSGKLEDKTKEASNNQMWIFVALIGGAVGGYVFQDYQKKKKMPGPMANAGMPGYQPQQNKRNW